MKTTIETISGNLCTVVWYDALGHMGKPYWMRCRIGYNGISALDYDCIATALPALPRHPKPEDAALLYRYMAEGISISINGLLQRRTAFGIFVCFNKTQNYWELKSEYGGYSQALEECVITHALDTQGNRVEIAIREDGE